MRAVIYARFSSDSQREESIEGQLRECYAFAEAKGITVVGEYIDRALSASKDTDKRLDFLRMIKDSSKKLFDIVLVWKLDRFARSRYDSAHYKAILKKNNVKVVSATEPVGDGSMSIIVESMLEGMAEYYSVELSEKIHRGQKENALKGKNNGGAIPLGYQLNKETQQLEINEVTAPLVQEIFRRYAAGDTIAAIKNDFNQRGLKTNKGYDFKYSTFNTVLKNRKYIGEYKYQDVVIPGGVPAIVDQDTFDRVQARMAKNKQTPAAAKAEERYLLTTKLFCGNCGKMMAGESGKSTQGKIYRYYKCHSAKNKKGCHKKPVRKNWIEDLVFQQTMLMVMDGPLMERIVNRIMEVQNEEDYDLKLLEQQLSETENGIENMINAIQAGIITASTKQRLEELENKKAEIERSIIAHKIEHPVLSREQIEFYLNQFKNTDANDMEQKQRLIDSFVNAVYVYDDKIILTFNYKEGTKTVSLRDIDSSDLESGSPPNLKSQGFRFSFCSVMGSHPTGAVTDSSFCCLHQTPKFVRAWVFFFFNLTELTTRDYNEKNS